jgi:hypothetical protein
MTLCALIDFGVFARDAFDQVLPRHPVETICDLVFAWHEQWVPPDQRDADLDGREPAVPGKDDAADGTRHAAAFEYK